MNNLVSVYSNRYDTTNTTALSLSTIAQVIANNTPQIVGIIHQIRACNDHSEKTKLKGMLPLFTCCGTFTHRAASGLSQYSNYICLDFDGITTEARRQELKASFRRIPYVLMMFESPSHGLKVICRHNNSNPAYQKTLFDQLRTVPEFNVPELDTACYDVARGTYISYDPDLYFNAAPIAFNFQYVPVPDMGNTYTQARSVTSAQQVNINLSSLVNNFSDGWTDTQILNWVNNHFWKHHAEDYQEGHRKASLMRKAGRLCAWGVGYEAALKELMYRYTYKGLTEAEVQEAVDYCYSRNDFGSARQEVLAMRDVKYNPLNKVFQDGLRR